MLHFIIIALILAMAVRYAGWIALLAVLYGIGWLIFHLTYVGLLIAVIMASSSSDQKALIGFGIVGLVLVLLIWLPKKYPILLTDL